MIKNYLVILIRYIIRYKGFTFINLAGLTLGMACTLFIILYVKDEISYDRFHDDAGYIHRVGVTGILQHQKIATIVTGAPMAHAFQQEIPGVASATRIMNWATFPARYEEKVFTEQYLLLADANFFRFFDFDLIHGHPDIVLRDKRSVVITESAAKRYFNYAGPGDKSPIGKKIMLAQGYESVVTGIAADPPRNSHIHFTLVLSLHSWDETESDLWHDGKTITYFKIKPGASIQQVEEQMKAMFDDHVAEELLRIANFDTERHKAYGDEIKLFTQPLTDIHLHSHYNGEIETNGDIRLIYLFASIAVFITMLACINFINLTTARSASRAKEVAVRKTVGAQNIRLIRQFLIESYLFVVVSVLLALFVVMVMLGPFNYFTGKHLTVYTLLDPVFMAGAALFVMIIGLLAGSYPAFYLTRFNPVDVLKGKLRSRLRTFGIRNVLVIFQFFISAGLIISTLVVYEQLRYIQRMDLGFDKTHLINLLHARNLDQHAEAFKRELLTHPEIIHASYANRLPPNLDIHSPFQPEGDDKTFLLTVYEMDHDHPATMGYVLKEGRFFQPGDADSAVVILNETAARQMSLGAGQHLISYFNTHKGHKRKIIGIVRDFNFRSLREPIQPLAMIPGPTPNWEMAIRISGVNTHETIDLIHSVYGRHAPQAPFEFSFLEQNFARQYHVEKRVGMLFLAFTLLAIVIACLGLIGLASFTAEQRIKEIGIHKVVGASVWDIIYLLNKDFLKLVLIANLLAWPVAWWLMNQWLEQFAFHITIYWWIFVAAGALSVVIAMVSVSYHAIAAAIGNPTASIRNE